MECSDKQLLANKPCVGVVAVNSPSFVKTVFESFARGKVVVFLKDANDTYKIQATGVKEIVTPEPGFGWCDFQFVPQPAVNIAQVSFTSGTTGTPKGVILAHEAINDVVERLNTIMGVNEEIREYVGIPVNYSFGFGRCRAVATAGGKFYVPELGFNPLEIRDMLLDGSINAISAVPSLWRSFFQSADFFGKETHAVRWIEIGSQYMSREEKEKLIQLFPQARIVQHYGLTEASRTTFLEIDRVRGPHLESVGKAYGKTEVRLSADGRICIKGPHVARNLLVEGEIKTNIDAEQWHQTNDLGRIEDGYIYFEGRADDLINCGGIKVFPEAFEKSLRQALNLQTGIAVAKIDDDLRGDGILVANLPDIAIDRAALKQAAIEVAASFNVKSESAIKFLELAEFPSTATGKIQRKQMAKIYKDYIQQQDRAAREAELNTDRTADKAADKTGEVNADDSAIGVVEQQVAAVWKEVLGVEAIDLDKSFFELGGDSLTAISVMLKMERTGLSRDIVRGLLQGLSIREIAGRIEGADRNEKHEHAINDAYTAMGMNINIVRGILALCVVASHWADGVFNRLPESLQFLRLVLEPFFSAGTPGFAVIYGITAGYSMFNIYKGDRERFRKYTFNTSGFLLVGILIRSLFRIGRNLSLGEVVTLTDVAGTLYSPLTYFFLITITLPLWFGSFVNAKFPIARLIFGSILSYSIYSVFLEPLRAQPAEGLLELAKLSLSAKYSYFNLCAGSLAGMAMGLAIRNNLERKLVGIPSGYVWGSLSSVVAGLVVARHAGQDISIWLESRDVNLWDWLLYWGVVVLVLAVTRQALRRYDRIGKPVKLGLQYLSSFGILAFPVFMIHDLLLPAKVILEGFGVPASLALAIGMGTVLAIAGVLLRKVHQANFTWQAGPSRKRAMSANTLTSPLVREMPPIPETGEDVAMGR